jgi:hypothetical protein
MKLLINEGDISIFLADLHHFCCCQVDFGYPHEYRQSLWANR